MLLYLFNKDASSTENKLICDVLCDFVVFAQFKKREKHPWRSVTFSKSNTPPWVLFTFFKLYKWYQIEQNITYIEFSFFHNCLR